MEKIMGNGIQTPPHLPHQEKTLFDLLNAAIQEHPDKPALRFWGTSISYRQLGDMIDEAAAYLVSEKNIRPGDRVGLDMPNTPFLPVMAFAILKCGGHVVSFPGYCSKEDFTNHVRETEPKLMVTVNLDRFVQKTAASTQESGCKTDLLVCKLNNLFPMLTRGAYEKHKEVSVLSGKDIRRIAPDASVYSSSAHKSAFSKASHMPSDRPEHNIQASDTALYLFTGGTSGKSKVAVYTHEGLVQNTLQSLQHFSQPPDSDPDERYLRYGEENWLGILPLSHVYGFCGPMLTSIASGGTLILEASSHVNDKNIKRSLQVMKDHDVTVAAMLPGQIERMTEPQFAGLLEDIKRNGKLKTVISGGSALHSSVALKFEHLTGAKVVQGYGATETGMIASNVPVNCNNHRTVGRVYPGTEIKFIGPAGETVEPGSGKQGEICVRGPGMMKEYLFTPEDDDPPFTPDGYYKTGDIGYLNESGHIVLTSLRKNMLIVNGVNVFPEKTEHQLRLHNDVEDVVVVGRPVNALGEVPYAFVKLKPGADTTAEEIVQFLKGSNMLARQEIPSIENISLTMDDLPRTPLGKPDRKQLQGLVRSRPDNAHKPGFPSAGHEGPQACL